ncbi:MAG: glycosyltransferase [Candidatus Acetothermia bacterium]
MSKVKEEVDSRLVLLGAPAIDDPEGPKIYKRLIEKVKGRDDVIVINKESDILVNVLQRVSSVVLQKSLGEGFGLTVTEALWKGAAVVASDVGGIPLQIVDEETGFLVDPNDHEQVAEKIIRILEDPELRAKLGGSAYNQVEEHFLIIHQLLDWIKVLKEVLF